MITPKQFNYLFLTSVLLAMLAAMMLCSCASHRQMVQIVEHNTRDTVSSTKVQHDSVYIFVDRYRQADTVFLTKYEYKYKIIHDSIYQCRVDSIPVIREVEVPVESHGFLYKSGVALWIILAVLALATALKIYLKFQSGGLL